jgi:hypothetical protein
VVLFVTLLLTARIFLKLLIFRWLNGVPCFLAEQKKSFAETGLAHLMTLHSQIYPQLLGISRSCPGNAGAKLALAA